MTANEIIKNMMSDRGITQGKITNARYEAPVRGKSGAQ